MIDSFIQIVSDELRQAGYQVEARPQLPGVQALLYARSPRPFRLAFARVEDHFLFVDWENSLFGRPDQLPETYRRFSQQVNRGFRLPHALRVTLPNLAVAAVSRGGFPAEAVEIASSRTFQPWSGGEAGQVVLIDLAKRDIVSLKSLRAGRYPRYGALPLEHAAAVIRSVSGRAFAQM